MPGAPLGNQNAARGRRWRAAIERALERKANGKPPETEVSDLIKGLDMAADAFITQLFATKDVALFKELGDRLDGKAPQAITGEDGGALIVHIAPKDASVL